MITSIEYIKGTIIDPEKWEERIPFESLSDYGEYIKQNPANYDPEIYKMIAKKERHLLRERINNRMIDKRYDEVNKIEWSVESKYHNGKVQCNYCLAEYQDNIDMCVCCGGRRFS